MKVRDDRDSGLRSEFMKLAGFPTGGTICENMLEQSLSLSAKIAPLQECLSGPS